MNISTHIHRLFLVLVVMFVAVSGGLVYWQAIVAGAVTENVHNSRTCLSDSAPVRGRIFDRNGKLLAESVPDPHAVCGYHRKYYDSSLAGLIGYYISPSFAATGIEKQYNAYLSGEVGMTALNTMVNKVLHQPPVGDDIYLTIDDRIQQLVNQHFDDPIQIDNTLTFASDRGAVIVMDPHTGEILAMVSRPSFDPNRLISTVGSGDLSYYNQLAQNREQPLLERPIQDTYIPGSSYKAVTLMAGLDTGKTTLQEPFDEQHARGPIFINGQQIGPIGNNIDPYTFRFPVTTEYGFAHSDNVIFAQLGLQLGADSLLDYNKRFYVGEEIPFDLPVVKSSILKNGQPLNQNELAADAFGQGYDAMTPLQMALFNNAIANNGQLMRPMLVAKIVDPSGSSIQINEPQTLGTPISAQTATEVRQAMYGVVRCGSLSGTVVPAVYDSPWDIIGKTSTGQVSDSGNIGANGWVITQAPYAVTNPSQLPRLTIVAMKQNAGDGGPAVGPMIAHMYNDIFSKRYVSTQTIPSPSSTYCCSAKLLQVGCF
jgi:peptidoglycan glycosyltransferase